MTEDRRQILDEGGNSINDFCLRHVGMTSLFDVARLLYGLWKKIQR